MGSRPVFQVSPPWAALPATYLAFGAATILIIVFSAVIDRSYLIDQQNYVDNFASAATLNWLRALPDQESILQAIVVEIFSEEILWRIWATVGGSIFEPSTAVVATVLSLNLLIVAAVWKLEGRTLAIVLWLLIPVGFAVTGLLQLRQGFAFSIMLFCALGWRKPVLGAAVAGMVHTTFAVAFVFASIGWLLRSRPRLAIAACVGMAFLGAYSGGLLFDMFGGRRVLQYSVQEGATSINYVFGGLLCITPSIYWLLSEGQSVRAENSVISRLALIHIGTTAFTLFSFFLFPLGAGRIGYLTQLLLIPMLPALRHGRRGRLALAVFLLLMLYLIYLTGKSYLEGVYDIYFQG